MGRSGAQHHPPHSPVLAQPGSGRTAGQNIHNTHTRKQGRVGGGWVGGCSSRVSKFNPTGTTVLPPRPDSGTDIRAPASTSAPPSKVVLTAGSCMRAPPTCSTGSMPVSVVSVSPLLRRSHQGASRPTAPGSPSFSCLRRCNSARLNPPPAATSNTAAEGRSLNDVRLRAFQQ